MLSQQPSIGVDLDRDPMLGTGAKDGVDVQLVAFTPQQQASRQVAENGCVRVRGGSHQPSCLPRCIELEAAMHACHDVIKAGQTLGPPGPSQVRVGGRAAWLVSMGHSPVSMLRLQAGSDPAGPVSPRYDLNRSCRC